MSVSLTNFSEYFITKLTWLNSIKQQPELNKTKFIDLLIIQIRAIIKQQKLGAMIDQGKACNSCKLSKTYKLMSCTINMK
jgi:hypothetical protein